MSVAEGAWDCFKPGANWTSTDGKRTVVVEAEIKGGRCRTFAVRNPVNGRSHRIEISGLTRKYNFVGYDPAYAETSA